MKKISIVIMILILSFMFGCKNGKLQSIDFLDTPKNEFRMGDNVDEFLSSLKFIVKTSNKIYNLKSDDKDLKISGLDFSLPGSYKMVVNYKDQVLEFDYKVLAKEWNGGVDVKWYKENESTFDLITPEQVAGLAKLVNDGNTFKDKTIFLNNDIDLNNVDWIPIGTDGKGVNDNVKTFKGTFDGKGNVIYNIKMKASHENEGMHIEESESYYNCGLFGHINDATIKNVKIKNVNIMNGMMNDFARGRQGTASLVGLVSGKSSITNIDILGSVMIDGEYKVGGVIGAIYGTEHEISNLRVNAMKTSYIKGTDKQFGNTNNYGGIIGFSEGTSYTIKNCISNINVSGYTSGGIIGSITGENTVIDNCIVYGNVSCEEGDICGGIVGGRFEDFTIKNCYMLGSIMIKNDITNTYADVIVSKYGVSTVNITSENIYYESSILKDGILNSLSAVSKTKDEILNLISDDLKLKD